MREKLLIDILRDKEIVSLKNIISTLSLSERTIRTQIKNLNTDGKKHGFIIDNIRGKGYRLKVIDYIKFEKYYNYLIKKVSIENTYNQEERVNKILEIFLFAKENLTIDNIAKKLDYSRSTIIKDLVLVDKKLKQFNLSLEKRSNKGIKINSDEIDIRKAISSYIYSNTKYCDFEDETKNNIFIIAKKIFIEEIIENKIDISNIAIENIFCYLKILIFRIENKNFLSEKLYINYCDNKFKNISKKIINYISKELRIEVPKKEIDYLASQIFYKSRSLINEDKFKNKVIIDIDEILKNVDEKFYTNFSEDIELKKNLSIHLCSLINRAKVNIQLKNPYFEEVNSRYSAIVLIVVNFISEFCKRWNFKIFKDEIAFLTIHFATHFEKERLKILTDTKKIAIVCPQDGGIQYFLKLKIEENFRNVVIDTYSYVQVEHMNVNKYDFVITNINLDIIGNYDNVFVLKKFFDNKEFENIVKSIEKAIENSNKKNIDNLDGILFKKMKGGRGLNYKKILEEESSILFNMGVVNENFYNSVLKREELLSTVYQNNIAAPHSLEMDSNKNYLSVINFEDMIDWEDKKVRTIFLIAMKKGSFKLNTKISNKISNLINDSEKRTYLKEIDSKDEFNNFFRKL